MGNAGVLAVVMLLSAAVPGQAGEPVWNVARVGGPVPVAGAVVAVVDSGVDAGHPTFGGRVLAAIDLVGGSGGDPNGHGTHVAGTAGGGDAGPGVGVAPAVSILPVRVLGPDGSGQLSTVAEGIRRATDAGADVINLSLGDDVVILNPTRQALADAIHYAWSRGAICVLAAGNEGLLGVLGSGYGDLPAVVVTATGFDDRLAPYATRLGNVRWGLSAPGGDGRGDDHDILSAWPGGTYARMAGTSMAAPHVSGALAVLRSLGLDPTAAVHRLLGTARPIGPAGTYGSGLLDLGAAVSDLAVPTSTAPPQPVPPGVGQEPATETPAGGDQRGGPAVGTTAAETTTPPPGSDALVPPSPPADDLATGERPRDARDGPSDSTGLPLAVIAVVAVAVAACAGVWLAAVRVARLQNWW